MTTASADACQIVCQRPCLLGVMMMCGRNYALLHELDIDEARRQRLFFGLLNVRIILAALRSAMAIRQLSYPDDLRCLNVASPAIEIRALGFNFPCTGQDLYSWSAELEATICEMLDSFGPLQVDVLPGNDSLFSLSLIGPDALAIDAIPSPHERS